MPYSFEGHNFSLDRISLVCIGGNACLMDGQGDFICRLVPDKDKLIELVFSTAMTLYEYNCVVPKVLQAVEAIPFVFSKTVRKAILEAFQSVTTTAMAITHAAGTSHTLVVLGDHGTSAGENSTIVHAGTTLCLRLPRQRFQSSPP